MILSASWYSDEDCGCVSAAHVGRSQLMLEASEAITHLVGQSLKYLSRMTKPTRAALCAAALAVRAWQSSGGPRDAEIGILCADDRAVAEANHAYFSDYNGNGRSTGRGNLFIYTLPTSALGEVAIALGLTGPTLYLSYDSQPLASLLRHARRMVNEGECAATLVLWMNGTTCACLLVGASGQEFDLDELDTEPDPMRLIRQLQSKVG